MLKKQLFGVEIEMTGITRAQAAKIVFRSILEYTAQQKVTIMRNILTQRLGLHGDEFKTCRLHIMTPLKKSAGMNVAA